MVPIRSLNKPFSKSLSVAEKNGVLRTIRVDSKAAATVYLLYFDRATVPSNGAIPSSAPVPIVAGGYYESANEFHFNSGLQIHASSTAATLTAIAGDDVWFTVQFEK